MPKQLDSEGKALLSILVEVLRDTHPDDPGTFITYSKALERLGVPRSQGNAGRILGVHGLDSLSEWARESDVPAVTGLIVRDAERDPGKGFFTLYGKREVDDYPWWLEQVRRSKEFDWSPYLDRTTAGATPPGSPQLQRPGDDERAQLRLGSISPPAQADRSSAEPDLFNEARRIANLIFARVSISGEMVQRMAPERTAPEDLISIIYALLQARPLVCYLCGGIMQVKPTNRLFQPSPDRVDSSVGDYGADNLRLAHLACNLGKNASSVAEFGEWLNLIRKHDPSVTPD